MLTALRCKVPPCGMKININKTKVMKIIGENGEQLEQVLKYNECIQVLERGLTEDRNGKVFVDKRNELLTKGISLNLKTNIIE